MPGKTFVIVHGAWGASAAWTPVAEMLRQGGGRVFTPSLTGLGERRRLFSGDINLSAHIEDVISAIETEALGEIVLVGHSYGGMVITGVAERLAAHISHIAYLDAFLPESGESVFDLIGPELVCQHLRETGEGDGVGIPPLPRDAAAIPQEFRVYLETRTPQPFGTFAEKARFSRGYRGVSRRLYVLCDGWRPSPFAPAHRRASADPAWRVETFACGHLLQLEMTERLAALLAEFAES